MAVNRVELSPLSFLSRAADVYPDRIGFVRPDGTELTYGELRRRAQRLAERLRTIGVGRGDTVAVLAPNDVGLFEAHYGIPAAGAALVALNVRLAPREYAHILRHAGCRVLVVDRSLVASIADVVEDVTSLEQVVEIAEDGGPTLGDASYEEWLAGIPPDDGPLLLPDVEDQPIAINYTSGTTGEPKGAVYTHRGAYLNAMGQALELRLTPDAVYLWTLPMFHCNGWCFSWAVTAAGATHVGLARFDPGVVLDLVERHRVSHLCGAPIVLNALAADPSAPDRAFDHDILVATGGAPPAPTTIATLRRMGMDVVHLYGLTETYGPSLICEPQPTWTSLQLDELAGRMARQGVRTVNVEDVRVVDHDLKEVPSDGATMGEIVVRSNTVMQGYLDAPAATAQAFHGDWFHTGDLAVRHPDGYIEVRDRAKDIIISGGENISSIEVENVLAAHPDVAAVAVVARPDEQWGEAPVAYVTLRPGADPNVDELVAHAREHLAGYKVPREYHFGELPRTSTGKIRKAELREALWSGRG